MLAQLEQQEEWFDYCPNCGKWDQRIVEFTGWCFSCTRDHHPDFIVCDQCGSLFPAKWNGSLCRTCKTEKWLKSHADLIEQCIADGMPFTTAKKRVADLVRPICLVCGNPIVGGREQESVFCKKTQTCRATRRRFRTIQGTYQLTRSQAIVQLRLEGRLKYEYINSTFPLAYREISTGTISEGRFRISDR